MKLKIIENAVAIITAKNFEILISIVNDKNSVSDKALIVTLSNIEHKQTDKYFRKVFEEYCDISKV